MTTTTKISGISDAIEYVICSDIHSVPAVDIHRGTLDALIRRGLAVDHYGIVRLSWAGYASLGDVPLSLVRSFLRWAGWEPAGDPTEYRWPRERARVA